MLFGERDINAVVSRGSLELEIESAAKTFAQCKTPGFVDAPTEGSMKDELHASTLVKEAFRDDGRLAGYGAQDSTPRDHRSSKPNNPRNETISTARRRREDARTPSAPTPVVSRPGRVSYLERIVRRTMIPYSIACAAMYATSPAAGLYAADAISVSVPAK